MCLPVNRVRRRCRAGGLFTGPGAARGRVLEERALLKLNRQPGRKAGLLLARGMLAAFLAAGSLTAVVSNSSAKSLDGSAESASTDIVVAHSGTGVRMRTAALGDVLDVFPDGTRVTLRGTIDDTVVDKNGVRWWPVVVYGENGWIAGDYLDDDPSATADSSSDSGTSDSSSGEFAKGDRVAVQTDDGSGLAMRDEHSTDGKKLASLGDGDVVTIVSGPEYDDNGDAWYKITDGDIDAWVIAKYIVAESEATSGSGVLAADFGPGDDVAVASGDGTGLVMRDEPSTSGKRLGALGDGDVVTVVSGPETDDNGGGWYKITDGDINAWVSAKYLIAAPVASASSSGQSEEAGTFTSGDHVTAVSGSGGVNLRKKQGTSGTIVGALGESQVAEVVGGPRFDSAGNAWYKLNLAGAVGYAREDYLAGTSAALSEAAAASPEFIYPLASFTLTQPYGCTGLSLEPWNATLGCYFHNGVDLAAPAYTSIMATAAGTVTASGWCDCGLGWYVTIDHGNGFSSTYGHMAEQPWVSVGQQVSQGDVIGPVGSSGASTGPHTHFILMLNGVTVDPLQYVG